MWRRRKPVNRAHLGGTSSKKDSFSLKEEIVNCKDRSSIIEIESNLRYISVKKVFNPWNEKIKKYFRIGFFSSSCIHLHPLIWRQFCEWMVFPILSGLGSCWIEPGTAGLQSGLVYFVHWATTMYQIPPTYILFVLIVDCRLKEKNLLKNYLQIMIMSWIN